MADSSFCYVLMCHNDPARVLRLVHRIKRLSPTADVLVRHSVPDLFAPGEVEAVGGRVYRSATHIIWGDWTMVEAPLEALAYARATSLADHFVLVSGQDYPIRQLDEWERSIAGQGVDALVDVFPAETDDWLYRWSTVAVPSLGPTIVRRGAKYVWRHTWPAVRSGVLFYQGRRDPRWILGVRRPSLVVGHPPVPVVKGSLWMTLSGAAVDSVLSRHRYEDDTRAFFRRVRIPDESYIQSLLYSNPDLKVLDCPTTYARFDVDGWSATDLDQREVAVAARTPAAFARKLPDEPDAALMAELDRLSRREPGEIQPVRSARPGEPKLTGCYDLPALDPAGAADVDPGRTPVRVGAS